MQKVLPLSEKHTSGAKLVSSRRELIRDLVDTAPRTVAEVGVALGDFSVFLMETLRPSHFDAYDLFELHKVDLIWGRPTSEIFMGREHLTYYEERVSCCRHYTEIGVHVGDSSTNLNIQSRRYDLIYIDGDHEYEGVKRDAYAAIEKLEENGTLVFNDYIMFDYIGHVAYGIVPVVNHLCVDLGWRVTHFALADNMFCDIALRRG